MPSVASAPFKPGETFFGLSQTPVDDYGSTSEQPLSSSFEGKEYDDVWTDFSAGQHRVLSEEMVTRRIVRNVSGGTLSAKQLVKFEAGVHFGKRVDGSAASLGPGYPVDEFLTSTVRDDDLCFIVVQGPAKSKLPAASAQVIAYGSQIQSAGSGRVQALASVTMPTDSATFLTFLNTVLNSRLGFSRTSLASGNDGADVLYKVRRWD